MTPTANGPCHSASWPPMLAVTAWCGLVAACGLITPGHCPGQTVQLVAGGGEQTADATPRPAKQVRLREPFGVAFDPPSGEMVIVEMTAGQRVLAVDTAGQLRVIAGDGTKGDSGDGGPGTAGRFNGLHGVCRAADGTWLLADTFNNKVRRLAGDGQLSMLVGTGAKGFAGDGGPADQAMLAGAFCAELSPDGATLIVTDLGNRRIRAVDMASGVITTVAGNGRQGRPPDNAKAVDAPLSDPRAAVRDRHGRLYILERQGNALRVVESDGRIRTVINTGGEAGIVSAEGVTPALEARLRGPKHLCVDPRDDSVLIADAENHLIVRYDPQRQTVSRVAGTGRRGANGLGGPPRAVELNRPHGVAVHPRTGEIYITDSYNNRIVRIASDPAP